MLDSIHLEQQGTPSLTFVTEPFALAARAHAKMHGLPDLPLIVVPSDYLDRSDAAVAEKLAPLIDDVIEALSRGPAASTAIPEAPRGSAPTAPHRK